MRDAVNSLQTSGKKRVWNPLFYPRGFYPGNSRINNVLLKGLFSMLVLLAFAGCNNDIDEHYDRPTWLEEPVYQILQEKGNFTKYLACVDKTLYAQVLKGSGNYTVFAPNDAAFTKFLAEKGYSSIDAIPVEELTKIIGYSLVFNKFETSHLGDVLSGSEWITGASFKRRTSYYKTIYKEMVNGKEEWVIDNASTADVSGTSILTPYKYLPLFTSAYFSANGLSANDFTTFYPGVEYTGMNIPGGKIVTKDIFAQNGIIQEVDAVLYPLQNLDEMLGSVENDAFRNVVNHQIEGSYVFVNYLEVKSITEAYKKLYPEANINNLYIKWHALPVYPCIETYIGSSSTEQEGYTMFVPSNTAVQNFINNKILKYAKSLNELPSDVLLYFLQAHMSTAMVWPTSFKVGQNANGEFFNGEGALGQSFEQSGITKKQVASNGIMYNIDHVIKSKYFETVYSEALLNPANSLFNTVLKNYYLNSLTEDLMKSPLTGYTEENYMLIIPSDELFAADGYTYDEITKAFANDLRQGTITADDRIKRLVRMCIFKRIKNNEVNTEMLNFDGAASLGYDGMGYAVNDYGDMIRFRGGKIQAVGNILDNEWVEATEVATLNNGKVYTVDKMLEFSPRNTQSGAAAGWSDETMYQFITRYVASNPNASKFKQYVDLTMYNATDGTIAGINTSGFYTLVIPENEQIDEAIRKGYLPATGDVVATKPDSIAKATNFINGCFLSGTVVPDDGISRIMPGNYTEMSIGTMYKVTEPSIGLVSEKTNIRIVKENGKLVFYPKNIESGLTVHVEGVNTATVIRDVKKSNFMGPRAVIHAIDNFLAFKVNLP